MSVYVTTPKRIALMPAHDRWCAVGTFEVRLDPNYKVENLAELLTKSFGNIGDSWTEIGRALSGNRSALLAHTPACASNISDFGLMLAWSVLARRWITEKQSYLIVCNDPWIFRHLASLKGARSCPPPPLIQAAMKLALRGFAARCLAAIRLGWAAIRLAPQKRRCPVKRNAILVYAHPNSTAGGEDGYFGDLMVRYPAIVRLLHVDCSLKRARELCRDHRSYALHAWGSPLSALTLPFAKWRPAVDRSGANRWLIRRAAALEGSTGTAAMIRWQQICQRNWLTETTPTGVIWPWENHAWERDFVCRAKAIGANTTGYQHTTVGKSEFNHRPHSNSEGLESIPDRIITTGPATRARLSAMGIPDDRLVIGGAWRSLPGDQAPKYDPSGPVFVALPSDQLVAAEMVSAIRAPGQNGGRFLVKDHPMTPFAFEESRGVMRSNEPLRAQNSLSAVIYSSTTVGLEALIDGLPTFQFISETRIPLDVLPEGVTVPSVTPDTIAKCLAAAVMPPKLDRQSVFPAPDMGVWDSALSDAAL